MDVFNIVIERYKNDVNGNPRVKANFFYNSVSCNSFIKEGKFINFGKLFYKQNFESLSNDYFIKVLKDNNKNIDNLKILKLLMN